MAACLSQSNNASIRRVASKTLKYNEQHEAEHHRIQPVYILFLTFVELYCAAFS